MAGRLSFWGQPLLREEEIRDWRTKLDALKTFSESLAPYNTVGKLKNLRIGSDDIAAQKKNLEVLAAVEGMLELVGELGSTASYLSQAEMVLSAGPCLGEAGAGDAEAGPRQARRRIAPRSTRPSTGRRSPS